MRIDCNAFLGAYPWRKVPGTSPDSLVAALERTKIDVAWVTHLPSLFWRDPTEGNAWLYETARKDKRFRPVPTVHPGLAQWEQVLADAANAGAPAIRCDPLYLGLEPSGSEMRVLAAACGAARMPLLLAVRLEDGRQRHPNDHVAELPAAAVRALIRSDADVRLIVTHAVDARRGPPPLVGHQLDLGPARRSSRDAARHDRLRAVRVWHGTAAPAARDEHREARSARREARSA